MTRTARLFCYTLVMTGNLNRLVKTAEREIIRMPKTVRGFGVVFPQNIGRRMTIVAGRRRVMTRFLPAVVLLLHNVAVGARHRVVAHIRIAFRIDERINADADCQSECDTDDAEFDFLNRYCQIKSPNQ